jgi:molybdate transport system permease protein
VVLTSEEWSALALSFRVGLCSVIASLPAAIAVGYGLARWSGSTSWLARTARPMVQLAVDLPLVLPPVVTGYLLLMLLVPRGPVGAAIYSLFGVKLLFTWWAAVIASAVVSFPLMVRTIRVAFQSIDPRLELAARSLGAGPMDAFLSVSLPLATRGVVAGAVLAFARSLGEFGATIMVLGSMEGRRTLPLAIYSLANRPGGLERCWRFVLISVALACVALATSEWFERRQSRHELA